MQPILLCRLRDCTHTQGSATSLHTHKRAVVSSSSFAGSPSALSPTSCGSQSKASRDSNCWRLGVDPKAKQPVYSYKPVSL